MTIGTPGEPTTPRAPFTSTRRRVLKASLVSAPVLMTIASRPVLGNTCITGSTMASGNVSVAVEEYSCDSALGPSAWAKTKLWPTPYSATATMFVSDTTKLKDASAGTTFSGDKMMYALKHVDDGGMRELAGYITAALLNARMGYTPVLSEDTVRNMWNDFASNGSYQPIVGITWDAAEIVAYIKTTMPVP